MITFLLKHPIAVWISFIFILFLSAFTFLKLPISLLPSVAIPEIVVSVQASNFAPQQVENSILKPIREKLATQNGLLSLESKSLGEYGIIKLQFEYGTDMQLAYLDINEQIDRLSDILPDEIERPKVVKINTSDIPIARLQVLPKVTTSDLIGLSTLAQKVLKKRLEAIEGVSLVDINGIQNQLISITPKKEKMFALGITNVDITNTIRQNNQQLGSISVKDGQYRYFLSMEATLQSVEDIQKLSILKNNTIIPLSEVASITLTNDKVFSWHFFNQQSGVVITVHKQASAQMKAVNERLNQALEQFKNEFPTLDFTFTQNQTKLLDLSINNLQTSLLFGGLFAFIVLFLFLKHYRIAIIIGISLPSSLIISFLLFYLTGLSINIISLSGMALGIGMLIDNAIIVLDNISRNFQESEEKDSLERLFKACVYGTEEVMSPLISSVLTTLAVFVPLVFLNGLSGALFYDQALAVGITLFCSLLVSFILLPLCFWLFFRVNIHKKELNLSGESKFFALILKIYQWFHHLIFNYKIAAFTLLLGLSLSGIYIFNLLDKSSLPAIEKLDFQLSLDWNEPIEVDESKQRVEALLTAFEQQYQLAESDIGLKQFLIQESESNTTQIDIYFLCESEIARNILINHLNNHLSNYYPKARYTINDASNAFNQLFASAKPYFEARFTNLQNRELLSKEVFNTIVSSIPQDTYTLGEGWISTTAVNIQVDTKQLNTYQIDYEEALNQINQIFGNTTISEIRSFGEVQPIRLVSEKEDFSTKLRKEFLYKTVYDDNGNTKQIAYPLRNFINYRFETAYKAITSTTLGAYQALQFEDSDLNYEKLSQDFIQLSKKDGRFTVDFEGEYFEAKKNLQQMVYVLVVAILLLYFILAAQFESFLQPIIILLTLPLGITGSLLILWLAGTSINIMSAIGIVVMLGIMVNDAILKIDTINRLWRSQQEKTKAKLKEIIFKAGTMRLKPILMTSITTILALMPILFSTGIGADLQKPLALAVIGGLTIGTFTALFFIPISYYLFTKITNSY